MRPNAPELRAQTFSVIRSGTSRPLNSISWIMSITRCNSSGSGSITPPSGAAPVPEGSGMIFHPLRPEPTLGFIEKLISLPGTGLILGVPARIGVPPLDLEPDRSRLDRKFRALRASRWISRARLELGLDGVPGVPGVPGRSGGLSETAAVKSSLSPDLLVVDAIFHSSRI